MKLAISKVTKLMELRECVWVITYKYTIYADVKPESLAWEQKRNEMVYEEKTPVGSLFY